MGEAKKNSWKAKFKGGPKDIFLEGTKNIRGVVGPLRTPWDWRGSK